MKLALVVPSLAFGGGVPTVAKFIRNAASRAGGIEVKLLSLSTSSRDPHSLLLSNPSSLFRGHTTSLGSWEGSTFTHVGAVLGELEFQRYCPRSALSAALADCDVIQVVCGSPAWANSVLGLGKPVSLQVATRAIVERVMRDGASRGPMAWWRRKMTAVTDLLDDRALLHADAIQVENPWMLAYASDLNRARQVDIRYAPPGIDAARFAPADGRDAKARPPYLLCVGRLDDPRKNVSLLLAAFALVRERVDQAIELVLAGSSGPPQSFWRRCDELGMRGRVRFVQGPSEEELIRLYQQARVFLLPSDEEGFGMVVLESMACATPVVSTRSGGPDGIITDGVDGFLVPRGDAESMAQRLVVLLNHEDLRQAMGQQARSTIEARYAEEIAGQAFVDTWERLVAGHRDK